MVSGLGLVAVCCGVASPGYSQESASENKNPPAHYAETLNKNINVLSQEDAEASIARALEERDAGRGIVAHILGKLPSPVFRNPEGFDVEVRDLQFFPESGRFVTTLTFVGHPNDVEGTVLGALNVQGRYAEYVRVPVMRKRVPSDSLITDADIQWVSVPKDKVRRDTITRSDDLIGLAANRTLAAGRPLRTEDVKAPVVVKKGSEVTLLYRRPYLELRAIGVALQDGSIGETVSIRNKDSNKVVQGVVEDATTVQVISVGGMPSGGERGGIQ
ncbi:MAG: flagellar basal body P-ring formation protein FlgA [Alphaproteobacteria bacterium]|nr:flagellar basal body P-ring formation protein FlgA [Alphaproteobacteria bacterium]